MCACMPFDACPSKLFHVKFVILNYPHCNESGILNFFYLNYIVRIWAIFIFLSGKILSVKHNY